MAIARVEARTTRIDCPNCARTAESEIRKLRGVAEARVDLLKSRVIYSYDSDITTDGRLRSEMERLGHFRFVDDKAADAAALPFSRALLWSLISSIVIAGLGLMLLTLYGSSEISAGLFYLAIGVGGWDIVRRAFASLRNLRLDMNALMAIAIVGAIAIGDLFEALSVVILFDLANLLESFSLWKLSRNLTDLQEFTSEAALLKQGEKTIRVSPESLQSGDIVVVREGMRVPADGEIVSGSSSVDMSSLTGEPQPVAVNVGAELFAGSMNLDGYLEIRVTSTLAESRISQIMSLVEEASGRKAKVERLVDRFAQVYTPVVVALAVLVAVVPPLLAGGSFVDWFYKALVFLVISCPCALVISTPVAVTTALAAGSRLRAIIRGGDVIERLARVRTVAFDKTGTLTSGRMQLREIELHSELTRAEAIAIAAGLESVSNHPVAAAVMRSARSERITPQQIVEQRSLPGVGVTGTLAGRKYAFGGVQLLSGHDLQRDGEGATSFLMQEEKLVAVFRFMEEIRPEAEATVAKLRTLGLHAVGMISGDRRENVEKLSERLGLDFAYAEQLPDDKFRTVSGLGENVAMVGDGINDVVALSGSDLSVSIGKFGGDIPARHADIVLYGDSIAELPELLKLGRRTLSLIKGNIAFAFGVKLLFLALAALGYANIWMAVVADMGASLAVIFNSLRLLRR